MRVPSFTAESVPVVGLIAELASLIARRLTGLAAEHLVATQPNVTESSDTGSL